MAPLKPALGTPAPLPAATPLVTTASARHWLALAQWLTHLARAARRRARPVVALRRPASPALRLEFHAEDCAPEGALYLDGELIGHLPGVTRL